MKLKKILAVTIGATLALSTALALTACGNDAPTGPSDLGTTALELDNYVTQLDEYETPTLYNSKTTAKIAQISETGETLLSGADYQNYKYFLESSDLKVFQKGEGDDITYRIYSVNSGKVLESGIKDSEIANISTKDNGGISIYVIATGDETNVQGTVTASDGTVLLAKDKYRSEPIISSGSYYVGNDTERSTVYTITVDKAVSATETQEIVKYFRLNVDKKTGVKTYSEVQESSLNLQPAGEYEVGSYDKNYRKIYESTEEKPVEGDIADYEYYNAYNTVKFYKNGEQTGEVKLEYGNALAFVGNYLYYYTEVSVSPDATSGYNYVVYNNNVNKYEYHLYRYDIVANSTAELNYNVKIDAMRAQYNYETKSYDAALVRGLKMTNGVFVDNDEYNTYLTNADLKVAYDLTNKAGMPTYKLSDGKYLVYSSSKYLVADKDLEYVTDYYYSYNYVKSYVADNITVFQANGKYGLKDLDGKIVVAPVYDDIGDFYDGYAVATKTVNGEQQKYLLGANGKVTEMPVTDTENGKYVYDMYNGLYYVSERVEDAYTYNITVKDYAGNTVKTFADSVSNRLSVSNGILAVAQTSDSVSTVTYYVVK